MIKKKENTFDEIISATCDCCGNEIKKNFLNQLEDHMIIGGRQDGKVLDAVVCIPCMEEKLSFIKIWKNNSTIGYC